MVWARIMRMPKIWEILTKFKQTCKVREWKTCESHDWVKTAEDYHNFLCVAEINTSSFRRIVSNRKCVVREGVSYNVVEASYIAWLFSKRPSEDLVRAAISNPDFFTRTAIYDMSPILDGKRFCLKINNTDSTVFQEFEMFLQHELKVNFKPLPSIRGSKMASGKQMMPELA